MHWIEPCEYQREAPLLAENQETGPQEAFTDSSPTLDPSYLNSLGRAARTNDVESFKAHRPGDHSWSAFGQNILLGILQLSTSLRSRKCIEYVLGSPNLASIILNLYIPSRPAGFSHLVSQPRRIGRGALWAGGKVMLLTVRVC